MTGRHRAATTPPPWPLRVLAAAALGATAVGGLAVTAAAGEPAGQPAAAAPTAVLGDVVATTTVEPDPPAATTAPPPPTPEPVATTPPPPVTTTAAAPTTTPPPPPPEPAPEPVRPPPLSSVCSSTLAGTVAYVARAGHHLAEVIGVPLGNIGGRGARSGTSDHPSGHALDFIVSRATGDRLAVYALEHRAELGITYVIWRQRYNSGSGWDAMADRGSTTANHYDHVHVSFAHTPPPGGGLAC